MESNTLLSILRKNVNDIVATVNSEFLFLDDATLNFKKSRESWSILQCFEHLTRYNKFYNVQFEKAILNTQFKESSNEVKSTWMGRKFIRMMHPDTIKKMKTVKSMDPTNSSIDRSVLDEFLSHQSALLKILDEAEHVDLNNVKIPVEFFKLLKMNLGDALQFVIVHEQRHLLQAKAVLKSIQSGVFVV